MADLSKLAPSFRLEIDGTVLLSMGDLQDPIDGGTIYVPYFIKAIFWDILFPEMAIDTLRNLA